MNTCPSLPVGGQLGWRLPTIEELGSLIRGISASPFVLTPGAYFWSSTTDAGNAGQALGCSAAGVFFIADKGLGTQLWCVRGGYGHG